VVSSFYKVLPCKKEDPFPWRSIWRTKVPFKVAFFAWSVALGKILTLDNLRKMHVIVIDRCCMCKMNGETVDHLLHCEVARVLWNAIFSCFTLYWVMPLRVVDLFACWWRVVALGVLLCGRGFLLALCGACGGNEMIETSRTKK
jgi:hypothetical protein